MLEDYSDSLELVKHLELALFGGSSVPVVPNTSLPSQPAHSVDSTLQQRTSQGSQKSQSLCLAPRTVLIKEQALSDQVATKLKLLEDALQG